MAGFLYFLLLGGTPAGDISPALRTLNALVGGALIAAYVVRAPRFADRLDKLMLLGLVLFTLACALSVFPRQSFDAALAAAAYIAAFFLMRGEFESPRSRRFLVAGLSLLSLVLTMLFTSLWLPEALAWRAETGDLPPLALRYPSLWWSHRYDVGLLLLLLIPSWWIGRPTPVRFALGAVTTLLTVLLVMLTGSRTLWLAALVGGLLAFLPFARRYLATHHLAGRVAILGGVVAVVALAATELGAVIVERMLASETVAARGEMWVILLEEAIEHPVAGLGPGSFPWILQATNYFDTNSWAPRHPDSAVFQLIAEAGGLGLAAAGAWIAAVAPAIWRSRLLASRWAIATFAFASLATSTTDFGFLVILVAAWIAYAVPRHASTAPVHRRATNRAMQVALVTGSAIVAMAFASMTTAMYAYTAATDAIARNYLTVASEWLSRAITLDPGMPLYWRQRGALELLRGDEVSARSDLAETIRRNPYDDLAWREAAIAERNRGDLDSAAWAASMAVALQRSDPTNLLLQSAIAKQAGDVESARDALSEVVQAWPAVTGAPGWQSALPDGISTELIVADAGARWREGSPSPEPLADQPLWLAAMGGDSSNAYADVGATLSQEMTEATIAVLTCSQNAAALLADLPGPDRRSKGYWSLVVAQESRSGSPSSSLRLLNSIVSASMDSRSRVHALNPLNENGLRGFSADKWGYRRRPVAWPQIEPELASPEWGYLNWILRPTVAIEASGLDDQFTDCR